MTNTQPSWVQSLSPPVKAAVHTRYGPPDVVRISDVEKPTIKDNEVRQGSRDDGESDRLWSPGCKAIHRDLLLALSGRGWQYSAMSSPERSRSAAP